ncbi:MAG: helix-turn-helix domain-containing protein [Alphaproteobacteria bacterium]|nr:helix-turn-helix domain-containing protein [Alphaproteobacteria bacterium]
MQLGLQTAVADRPSYAAASNTLKLGKHRSVFLAGDEADRFFEVESGAVMVYQLLDDGRRQVVEIVFPGGVCGLAKGDEHGFCCETLTPTVLRSHKRAALAQSDVLRARLVDSLQQQLATLHGHAVSLGRKTAEERICTLILRLQEQAGEDDDAAVALPMTRTEIADYLGLTLETVCRTITQLVRRKLLSPGATRSEIGVPSIERLRVAACAA